MIGLLLVLFLFLYLLFGLFLYGYIRGWGVNKPKAMVIGLIIMLGIPFWDVIPGKLYMAYLCHKDGGIKIYEVVDTRGYLVLDDYSYGCTQACIQRLQEWRNVGKPIFIEAFIDNPKEYNFVNKRGYYRFELVDRTPEHCAFQDYLRVKYPTRLKTNRTVSRYCLSVGEIDRPVAEYSVELWAHDNHVSDLFGIVSDNSYIRRVADNKIISAANRFTHLGGWFQRSLSNVLSGGTGKTCPSELSHGFRSELQELTFNNAS